MYRMWELRRSRDCNYVAKEKYLATSGVRFRLIGWFLFLFFAYPTALGFPMLSGEAQYIFWFAKLNFAEIIPWPVVRALPGGKRELAFVYSSLGEVQATDHSTWPMVSHHTSILALLEWPVFSSSHQETPGGKPILTVLCLQDGEQRQPR